jgi:beta-glucanase (GH16 family)
MRTENEMKKARPWKTFLVFLPIGFLVSCVFAEEIRQEFNSKADFNAFWNISTWSTSEQQYSASNVFLDTVNGWVRLKINASPQGTKPINGEIESKRNNFLHGSYRASIKFDKIPGGVVGWFVYRTEADLHEIDVEFLTEDIKNIHFTLHHVQTDVDYKKCPIDFDPTAAFHEYRFDWFANKVVYYIDGIKIDSLTNKVPDAACSILLNFWSANIQDWGGPAPAKDTYMYVDYMRYYSDPSTSTVQAGIPHSDPWMPIVSSGKNNSVSLHNESLRSGPGELLMYSALGKLVYHVRNVNPASVTNRTLRDASGQTGGVYFFKLTAPGFERKSMLRLMK